MNRFLKPLYDDQQITSDYLRKEIDIEALLHSYDNFITEKAIEGRFEPKIVI
jgi:hypothetical protein